MYSSTVFHELKQRCGSFMDSIQYSVLVFQLAIFGYVPRGMKITLSDVYLCIRQVCHEF